MKRITLGFAVLAFLAGVCGPARAADSQWLPTGQTITPLAAPGADFAPLKVQLPGVGEKTLGGAVTTRLSADGARLFVLTSGFNTWRDNGGARIADASSEHVLIYDVAAGLPVLKQDLHVPNAYGGLDLSADGRTLFVAGGPDDNVHVFRLGADSQWAEDGKPIALGHVSGNALIKAPVLVKPNAAGLAATKDGKTLLVANYENDSISVIELQSRQVINELDLRPGKIDPGQSGVPGGEFPYWIAVKGSDTAYVSSLRDREIDVISLTGSRAQVIKRIKIAGNPNRILLNRAGDRLYVASDNADSISVIDTSANIVTASAPVGAPEGYGPNARLPGASPNGLALSPDERTLFVSEGGINAVGVVDVGGAVPVLKGLIPTSWQPNTVSVSPDGRTLYVANGKSPAGANPRNCKRASEVTAGCALADQHGGANQYVWQLSTGGLARIPLPDGAVLKRLTAQTADNNGYRETRTAADAATMKGVRARIKHVIYIVKENRTYDQMLGDLKGADGDPTITQFGAAITPNEHAIAQQFVTLDAFFDSGEASGDGWNWTMAARTTDVTEREMPVNYAGRGLSYDFEGTTRYVNVAIPLSERGKANPINDKDPDLLPGPANQAAPDGPNGEAEQGYLWNAALRAGLTVRNYGFFLDLARYEAALPPGVGIPIERDPFTKGLRVSFTTNKDLEPLTDIYYRGFDTNFPDFWRFKEWDREFTAYEKKGSLPRFEMVRFMADHTGTFKTAIDGVNTPELQIADNDYAVGLLLERVAKSKFAGSTLVFVVEDDAQDGPDHVDAHRSTAFVAGPLIKQGAVINDRYTTVNMIRTIEDILSLRPLNFHDANARPMSSIFDLKAKTWTYHARPSGMLRTTALPLPPIQQGDAAPLRPVHDAAYWAEAMSQFDFSAEDRLDPVAYNRALWEGTMGAAPYPAKRSGTDLRSR